MQNGHASIKHFLNMLHAKFHCSSTLQITVVNLISINKVKTWIFDIGDLKKYDDNKLEDNYVKIFRLRTKILI